MPYSEIPAMSVINVRDRQITVKVVYYGPAAGGKTTSLQAIHRILDPAEAVQLVTLATAGDKTLFFDFLPIDLGVIGGFKLRVQGFTVPGQVQYALTRRYVLAGADGIIFVANSDPARPGENVESVQDLRENLNVNGLDPKSIPLVLQYNKRDLPDALSVEQLAEDVRFRPVPEYETTATEGLGVFGAFRDLVGRAVMKIAEEARVDARAAQAQVFGKLDGYYEKAEKRPAADPDASTVVISIPDGTEPASDDPRDLLGNAIESGVQLSRLYAEVNVARRRLELSLKTAHALNRLSRRLLGAETPGFVWKEFHRTCQDDVPTSASSLLICPGRGLTPVAADLEGLDEEPLLAAIGDRASTFLGELEGPVVYTEADQPDVLAAIRESATSVRAFAVVPVTARGSLRGAVILYRSGGHPPFHLNDTRFLAAAADLASLGLARALHERELAAEAGTEPNGTTAADVAREIGRPLATLQSSLAALGGLVDEIGRSHRRLTKAADRGEMSAVQLSLADPDVGEARESLADIVTDAGDQASRIALKLRMMMRAATAAPSDTVRKSRKADPAAEGA